MCVNIDRHKGMHHQHFEHELYNYAQVCCVFQLIYFYNVIHSTLQVNMFVCLQDSMHTKHACCIVCYYLLWTLWCICIWLMTESSIRYILGLAAGAIGNVLYLWKWYHAHDSALQSMLYMVSCALKLYTYVCVKATEHHFTKNWCLNRDILPLLLLAKFSLWECLVHPSVCVSCLSTHLFVDPCMHQELLSFLLHPSFIRELNVNFQKHTCC